MTIYILHILKNGPTELSNQIIDKQFGIAHIEVFDLHNEEITYADLIDKIFSCDRLICW